MVTTGTVTVRPSLRVYVTLASAIVAAPDSHCSTISWLTPSIVSQNRPHVAHGVAAVHRLACRSGT